MSEMEKKAPDYSAYKYQMDAYCYSGPNSGRWIRDGETFDEGKDLRTVEHYKDYKDAGMTIYFPQTDARIKHFHGGNVKPADYGDDYYEKRQALWEEVKVFWDRAYEAGLKKIIMMEGQIQQWSRVKHGMLIKPADVVIPDGEESPYTFQSEAEIDEVIVKVLKPYIDHPGFYGVMVADEPGYAMVEAYGQTCRAVKRVAKNVFKRDIFVQHNLIPMRSDITAGVYSMMPLLEWFEDKPFSISPKDFYTLVGGEAPNQEVISPAEKVKQILEAELAAYGGDKGKVAAMKYGRYIEGFVRAMDSDYVQYDDYPLGTLERGNAKENGPIVLYSYMNTLQAAAGAAKRLDIDLQVVSQSFASEMKGGRCVRKLSEADCRWINNMLLAFGVSQINYYTYIAKSENSAWDLYYTDDGSFITRTGEKTDIYYYYQKISQENNKFAPVKLNFKYQGSRVYGKVNVGEKAEFFGDYCCETWIDNSYNFVKLKDITVDKEVVLVTESYDKENDRYMYCVQNIVDPAREDAPMVQTAVLTFDSAKYQYAAIYRNGERTLQALENGELIIQNVAGEAAFVIPY